VCDHAGQWTQNEQASQAWQACSRQNLSDLSASLRHDSNDDYYYAQLNFLVNRMRCVRE
jgi:hypothetical protein